MELNLKKTYANFTISPYNNMIQAVYYKHWSHCNVVLDHFKKMSYTY